jgi:hypothetical protein
MSQITRMPLGNPSLPAIDTLTGNSGGPVGPDGSGNVNVIGSGDVTVTGNPGTNTLTISLTGSEAESFVTDSGTAVPVLGVLNVLGGTGIVTSGAGNTVTIDADVDVATTYTADAGTATPALNNINVLGGTSISTTAAGSTVTIDFTGAAAFTWNEIVGPTVMSVNNGYVTNSGGLVTATLPAVAAFGDIVAIGQKGLGAARVAQNAGQTIHFGTSSTTTGALGYIQSTAQYDTLDLLCITANTDWMVRGAQGNWTVI